MPRYVILAMALGALVSVRANEFYVSPTGLHNGDGSWANPWDLQTALNQPADVKPDDTIWLRGGVYNGAYQSRLRGSANAPIIVRSYPGEEATLDGGTGEYKGHDQGDANVLWVRGSYTWFWGFEVRDTPINRTSAQTGSYASDIYYPYGVTIGLNPNEGIGTKLINLVIHDASQGISVWSGAYDTEVYGCLVYHNGWDAPDRGHGHNIYTQNHTGGKSFTDNIVFGGFANGIQAYTADGLLNDLNFEGNFVFNSGALSAYQRNLMIGGGAPAMNPRIVENVFYYPLGSGAQTCDVGYYQSGRGTDGAVIQNNYFCERVAVQSPHPGLLISDNVFHDSMLQGFGASTYPENMYLDSNSDGVEVFLRLNRYEIGRAHIVVLNWDHLNSVEVQVSGSGLSPGDGFELRDAQNYYSAPVLEGTFTGAPLSIPMMSSEIAQPSGGSRKRAIHTGSEFGAFILARTATTKHSILARKGDQ